MIGLFLALAQASAAPVALPVNAITPAPPPVAKVAPAASVQCNAAPWRFLVGRTISDLLTVRLPAGTRIYRIDDPIDNTIARGRLSVEIGRNTRVRRVYCS